jgi:hypothetical protein
MQTNALKLKPPLQHQERQPAEHVSDLNSRYATESSKPEPGLQRPTLPDNTDHHKQQQQQQQQRPRPTPLNLQFARYFNKQEPRLRRFHPAFDGSSLGAAVPLKLSAFTAYD